MSAQSLTPDAARVLLNAGLAALDNEHQTTKRVIEAIPQDKSDYKPDAVSRSAIELAWHIVSAEKRFLLAVANGVFDLQPMPRPESAATPGAIGAWFDESFAENRPRLAGLSGEALVKPVDFRGLFTFPAVSFIDASLHHSVHHRGQLSMYLRPMGAKVPSIYGESYDGAQARLAREGKA